MIILPTEAFQDYVRHPLVSRLYLTDAGYFPCASRHFRERREGIEEYILLYCMKGSGVVRVEGREYVLRENEAFCIPRFRGHCYYACEKDPWSLLWVHFKGSDTEHYPLEECRVERFPSGDASGRMYFLFELLFRVLDGSYTLGNFIYLSEVLGLILAETYTREKQDSDMVQNRHMTGIIRYMYRHLSEDLTLEQLSGEFELSKSYLNLIFQRYSQQSPIAFFHQLKIKEACKLLSSTDDYVYEVARRVGYEDPYYFSRIFKKLTGLSPKDYRESGGQHGRMT